MRVDRDGGKGFISETPRSGKDPSIQKKGAKNKEAVSGQDEATIGPADSKIDPGVVSGRKEETELTANITRQFLSAELPDLSPPGQPSAENLVLPEPVELEISHNRELNGKIMEPEISLETGFLAMTSPGSMTSEQKASFVQRILEQPVVSESGEIITSVLMSAAGREEFCRIVDHAGGKNITKGFENKETMILFDHLAGAYDRSDVATSPNEAAKTKGILTADPQEWQMLLPESQAPLLLQTNGEKGPVDLTTLTRPASVCVALENAVRLKEGLAAIVPGDLREKVFDVLNIPDQPLEKRNLLLESLRTEANLTEFQMREIVSLPMAEIFESTAADLKEFRDRTLHTFEKQIEASIATYGADSVVVEIVKAEEAEFLDKIEPEINLFQGLQSVASQIFSGPADPLVQIDSAVHSVLNEFLPPTSRIDSMIEKLERGSHVFEPGNLDVTFQKMAGINIPELKNFVVHGTSFLSHLSKLNPDIQILIPELRPFQVLGNLYGGAFHRQVTGLKDGIQEFQRLPAVQQSVTRLNEWRKEYDRLKSMPDRSVAHELGRRMLEGFTNELFEFRLPSVNEKVQELDLASRIDGMIETVRTMGDLVVSLRNGHFVQVLSALNHRMAGSAAILQIIQQALHLTNSGAGFFRALFNREWEKPFSVALKKNPGNKDLIEAQSMFTDALNLFLPLESIDNLNPFLQYQKQLGILRDESIMRDRIHRHQS